MSDERHQRLASHPISGPEDFAAAFERALAAGKPAIIHVKTDPEALTSRITLSKLREQSLARQKH